MAFGPTCPTIAFPSGFESLFILLVKFCVAIKSAIKNSPNWLVNTYDCLLNIYAKSSWSSYLAILIYIYSIAWYLGE